MGEIIRTKERIQETAEVFTPTPLVNEMLDYLPASVFTDPDFVFIDPACGDGQFLIQILIRKIKHGSTIIQASNTILGVDLMEDNIAECKDRILNILKEKYGAYAISTNIHDIIDHNIVNHNAFTWNFKKWKSNESTENEFISF